MDSRDFQLFDWNSTALTNDGFLWRYSLLSHSRQGRDPPLHVRRRLSWKNLKSLLQYSYSSHSLALFAYHHHLSPLEYQIEWQDRHGVSRTWCYTHQFLHIIRQKYVLKYTLESIHEMLSWNWWLFSVSLFFHSLGAFFKLSVPLTYINTYDIRHILCKFHLPYHVVKVVRGIWGHIRRTLW